MKILRSILLVLGVALLLQTILTVVNIFQNGPVEPDGRTPEAILGRPLAEAEPADLERLSKSELMQLFLVLPPPAPGELRGEYDARLLDKGVLAGATAAYTHYFFGPGRWVGKGFIGPAGGDLPGDGYNIFERDGVSHRTRLLRFYNGASRIDGGRASVLDYSEHSTLVNHGMQDEVRRVNDRLFLCMGYMAVGGGSINPAPFLITGPARPVRSPDVRLLDDE